MAGEFALQRILFLLREKILNRIDGIKGYMCVCVCVFEDFMKRATVFNFRSHFDLGN